MSLYCLSAKYNASICNTQYNIHVRNYSILLFSNTSILDDSSLLMVAFSFCNSQLLPIRSLRDFLVHDNTKAARSGWRSFLLSSATEYNSVAEWMLFFINLLTCNLGKRLDLLFKLNDFFREGSEVAEASVDLAWPDPL